MTVPKPHTPTQIQLPKSKTLGPYPLPASSLLTCRKAMYPATLNSEALAQVKEVAEIRKFPEDVLTAFKTDFETVLDDVAASDAAFAAILAPWREFRDAVQEWHSLAESSMLRAYNL
ncbi:MAG: hypothetical protein P1T08_03775 [Acidimicrobiia bacterium]|nr:hypothetical protein [Acidimicrobiia bacterium]